MTAHDPASLELLAILAAPLVGQVLEAHRKHYGEDRPREPHKRGPVPSTVARDAAIAAEYVLHAIMEPCETCNQPPVKIGGEE